MIKNSKIRVKQLLATLVVVGFGSTACFSTYRIPVSELENLQTGLEAEEVAVVIDGCGGSTANSGEILVAQVDGGTASGCPTVAVSPTNSISVHTRSSEFRITPFNFTMSDTQLVAPDYDLLLGRSQLESAEVEVFSTGKTLALIGTITAVAVGSFFLVSILAPADRGLGQQ